MKACPASREVWDLWKQYHSHPCSHARSSRCTRLGISVRSWCWSEGRATCSCTRWFAPLSTPTSMQALDGSICSPHSLRHSKAKMDGPPVSWAEVLVMSHCKKSQTRHSGQVTTHLTLSIPTCQGSRKILPRGLCHDGYSRLPSLRQSYQGVPHTPFIMRPLEPIPRWAWTSWPTWSRRILGYVYSKFIRPQVPSDFSGNLSV